MQLRVRTRTLAPDSGCRKEPPARFGRLAPESNRFPAPFICPLPTSCFRVYWRPGGGGWYDRAGWPANRVRAGSSSIAGSREFGRRAPMNPGFLNEPNALEPPMETDAKRMRAASLRAAQCDRPRCRWSARSTDPHPSRADGERPGVSGGCDVCVGQAARSLSRRPCHTLGGRRPRRGIGAGGRARLWGARPSKRLQLDVAEMYVGIT